MSSSAVFTGAGFYVAGASQGTPGTVRVTYSNTPKASNPAGVNDALNPVNYVLSGPGPYSILSVQAVSGDPQSFDIILSAPLQVGTWIVAVSNVQTVASAALTAPTSAQFQVTVSATLTPLSAGAENDDAEKIIRKHLNPALRGPNWDALISALATGDDTNWNNARSAFDQLFLSTASGSYLDRRASDVGVKRPNNVGISDDLFRQLTIKTTGKKLVHQAIREILEIYYGQDSLRAFVECTVDENYNLSGSPTLTWVLDEKEEFTHTFASSQFGAVASAKANEIAFALTKTMRDLGSMGFAVSYRSPDTGLNRVRIYSGSLGLGSFARVTGGAAQNVLKFPTEISTYSGTITTGTGYSWTYSQPDSNTTRISLTAAGAGILISLAGVKEGDYVIIGADAQTGETGTFVINAVGISWSGANLTQYFDIDRITFTGGAIQASNSAYRFYQPTKASTAAANGRTVVVAQTTPGRVDISIPATTQAVTRGPYTGAYLKSQPAQEIAYLQRLVDGTVTITTKAAHGYVNGDVGKQILLDGVKPGTDIPYIAAGLVPAYPSTWVFGASHATIMFPTQVPPSAPTENGTATVLSNGQLLFAGGYRTVASLFDGEKALTNRYQSGTTALVIDGTEADGATQHSQTWISTTNLANARQYHAASVFGTGAMVSGGMVSTPLTFLSSAEIYTLDGSWNATPAMALGRAGHQQVTLVSGDPVVIGGAKTTGTATSSAEIYQGGVWSAAPTMNFPRTDFASVTLSDGTVVVMGGRTLGRGHDANAETLALWRLDEGAGPTAADAMGVYPLTYNGTPTPEAQGKINNALDLNFGATWLDGAGDADAVTALHGEWSLELWFHRSVVSLGQLVVYAGATGAEADNTLLRVGVDGADKVFWMWEKGAGVDVTATATTALTALPSYRPDFFNHLAIVKSLSGMTYTVKVSGWAVGDLIYGQASGAMAFIESIDGGAPGGASGTIRVRTANHLNFTPSEDLKIIPANNRTIDPANLALAAKVGVSLFDVTLYINGILIQTWTGQDNSTGGTTANWNVANDPKTVTGFEGQLDDIRVSKRARTIAEVRVSFLNGWGNHKSPHTDTAIGAVTNTCESLSGPSWTVIAPMNRARAFHKAVVLPGDYILVTGGLGYTPTQLSAYTAADASIWPSQSLNDAEIWDPHTNRWSFIQSAGVRRHSHIMEYVASRNEVVVMGGKSVRLNGVAIDNPGTIEILNLDTKTWRQPPTNVILDRPVVFGGQAGSEIVIMGGSHDAATNVWPEAYLAGGNVVSSGGLNGQFRITAVPSSTTIQIETKTVTEQRQFTSGFETLFGFTAVATGSRTSNVTTMVLTTGVSNPLVAGDYIFVNSLNSQFSSGLKLVSAVTSTSFSYADVAANQGSMAVSNSISHSLADATLTSVSAPETVLNAPGPIILDPDDGLAVTATEALTTGFALSANQQYEEVEIGSGGDSFPETEHFITFGFGTSNQTPPIKVLGKYKSGSSTRLQIDYTYRFTKDFPIGSTVTLLASRSAFSPVEPLDIGSAWLTAASAGRVAAQAAAEEALAAGIDPNVTIVYPGDRGLGGEGLPASAAQKLSDKVAVFAGDDVDGEVQLRRKG